MLWVNRWRLPLLAGAFVALALYPFYFWPLVPIALAPLFYFAWAAHSRRERLWGGCIAGAVAVAPTLYFSLLQLVPQPGAAVLTLAVRGSSIFFLFFIGALFGTLAVAVGELRSRSIVRDTLAAAALYTLLELLLFAVFSGYYYASLAVALAPFAPARLIVASGGMPFLVFVVAWLSAALARAMMQPRAWRVLAGGTALLALMVAGQWTLEARAQAARSLSVAVIQRQPQELYDVLTPASVPFEDPGLGGALRDAAKGTQLIVYPFSPVNATYRGAKKPDIRGLSNIAPDAALGQWLARYVPASTTVMLWNTVAQPELYDEFEFWRDGELQKHQKKVLFALSDYTPSFLRRLGMARLPYEITPGSDSSVVVEGVRLGGLVCSELERASYVRAQAARSDVLLSVGFDGFFPGPMAAQWSLALARIRAAEVGAPVVRAHIFGPSALIGADGALVATMPYGESGVMYGAIPVKKVPTLFALAGSVPVYLGLAASLLYALARRYGGVISRGSAGRQ